MDIRPMGNDQYAIDSETSEKSYTVSVKTGSCSCPHHQYRGAHCKHLVALETYLADRTPLAKAADKAANLTEQELLRFSKERAGMAAGCACWLELATRRRLVQAENQPEVDLAHHTCTCREFIERRDGKRIGVMFVTCRHLQTALKAARPQPEPRPIPAGVLAILEGESEEDRERCLSFYR